MKPEVSVESGGAEVIASGVGMTFSPNASFRIHLKFDEDFEFTVEIKFEEVQDDKHPQLTSDVNIDKGLITLTCKNFTDFIGTGTLHPLKLGIYNNRRIYLKFWVMTPEEKLTREIRYCFYLGEEVLA